MLISDWSSDVCSAELAKRGALCGGVCRLPHKHLGRALRGVGQAFAITAACIGQGEGRGDTRWAIVNVLAGECSATGTAIQHHPFAWLDRKSTRLNSSH